MANQFAHVQKKIYNIAAALDAQLRIYSMLMEDTFDDLEIEYLKNRLNNEKDPLVGTIIAQLTGLREPPETDEEEVV
jgi:hypothetical protein